MTSRLKPNRRGVPYSEQDVPPLNVRAPAFFVVIDQFRCWKCGGAVDVFALGVRPPFTLLEHAAHWREGTILAVSSYVERLPISISNHLTHRVPRFFCDESQWHRRPYWMNHCHHCGAKIGDYETIEAPGAPFNVHTFEASKLSFSLISEDFEAAAVLNKPCASKSIRPADLL